MNVGFIGTGTMGLPMVGNLLKKGFAVVAYDAVPAALDAAGGHAVEAAAVQAGGRPGGQQVQEQAVAPDQGQVIAHPVELIAGRRLDPLGHPVRRGQGAAGEVELAEQPLEAVPAGQLGPRRRHHQLVTPEQGDRDQGQAGQQ